MHPTSHRSLHCQVSNLQQGGSFDQELQKKGPATGSNLLSVSVTCHACGEKGHYKKKEFWLDYKLKLMWKNSVEDYGSRSQATKTKMHPCSQNKMEL
ncbi:hypothetical protein Tco_1310165 [Tanacetum coccineum]